MHRLAVCWWGRRLLVTLGRESIISASPWCITECLNHIHYTQHAEFYVTRQANKESL